MCFKICNLSIQFLMSVIIFTSSKENCQFNEERLVNFPPTQTKIRKESSFATNENTLRWFRKPKEKKKRSTQNTHKRQKPRILNFFQVHPKGKTNGRVTGDTCEHAGEGGGVDPSERFIGPRPEPDHLGLHMCSVPQPSRPHGVVSHLSSRWLRG